MNRDLIILQLYGNALLFSLWQTEAIFFVMEGKTGLKALV